MLTNNLFHNGHITPLALLAQESDLLNSEQSQLLLSHLNSCDECMDSYLQSMDEASLMPLPDNFNESIFSRLDEQRRETIANSKKLRAIQYGKLVVAACLTMVLFFGSAYLFPHGDRSANDLQMAPQSQISQQSPLIKEPKQPEKQEIEIPQDSLFEKITDGFYKGFYDFTNALNEGFRKRR